MSNPENPEKAGSSPAKRTIFSKENADFEVSRTDSAQNPERPGPKVKFPVIVQHRSGKARIYRKTESYPFYRVAWRSNGKRMVKSFPTYGEAHAEAKRKAREIAEGNHAASLTATEAIDAITALETLDGFRRDTGRSESLKSAVGQFCEAAAKLNGISLNEAVDRFLATAATVKRKDVGEAVEEFLGSVETRTKSKGGKRPEVSSKYFYNLGIILRRFAGTFPNTAVCELQKEHMDAFIDALADKSPKSRNHHRTAIKHWLAWTVDKDYLTATHRLLQATKMKPERTDDGEEIEFYTPKEFRALLEAADGPMQAVVAIAGLAGVRIAELLRLDWRDVWRDDGHIEVSKKKSKTRARRLIESCPALAEWLAPWRNAKGLVWPDNGATAEVRDVTFQQQLLALHEKAGVARKRNGLRHAFCTFGYALHGETWTARQAGHSPEELHRSYRGLATKAEAEKWFKVEPVEIAKVIELPVRKGKAG